MPPARSGAADLTWEEDWARLPRRLDGWAHNDIAVSHEDKILLFDTHDPLLHILSQRGELERSLAVPVIEAHGLTITQEGETEVLWVADIGLKTGRVDDTWGAARLQPSGQVVKLDLDGRQLVVLETPPHPGYDGDAAYRPTAVSADGRSGQVWVADGYGQGFVHTFDADGGYVRTISGQDGAGGRFDCPHAVFVDTRAPDPQVFIADRGNAQLQVFDLDGKFVRVIGREFLNSPSAFAPVGDHLVVAELYGRLAVIDADGSLIHYLGEQPGVQNLDGWPNQVGDDGVPTRPSRLTAGQFNSPHGLATTADGTIFVSEWLIGGRHIKLSPRQSAAQ